MPVQEEIESEVYPPIYAVLLGDELAKHPNNKRLVRAWLRKRKSPGIVKMEAGAEQGPHVWVMWAEDAGGTPPKIPRTGPSSEALAVFFDDPRDKYNPETGEFTDRWLARNLDRWMGPPRDDEWGGERGSVTFLKYGVAEEVGDTDLPTLSMIEAIVARACRKSNFSLGTSVPEFQGIKSKVGREKMDVEELRTAIREFSDRVLRTEYETGMWGHGTYHEDRQFIGKITSAARSPMIEQYTHQIGAKLARGARTESYDLLHQASEKLREVSQAFSVVVPCPECGKKLEVRRDGDGNYSRECRTRRPNPDYDPNLEQRAGVDPFRLYDHPAYQRLRYSHYFCRGSVNENPSPSQLQPDSSYHWEAHVPDGHLFEY